MRLRFRKIIRDLPLVQSPRYYLAMSNDCSLEFECTDCGLLVISIGPQHDPGRRCAGCQWLATLPDPVDREALRAALLERGIIGP